MAGTCQRAARRGLTKISQMDFFTIRHRMPHLVRRCLRNVAQEKSSWPHASARSCQSRRRRCQSHSRWATRGACSAGRQLSAKRATLHQTQATGDRVEPGAQEASAWHKLGRGNLIIPCSKETIRPSSWALCPNAALFHAGRFCQTTAQIDQHKCNFDTVAESCCPRTAGRKTTSHELV